MLLSSCTTRQSTWSIVYKALHVPKQMTQENVEGVTECLRVHHHFDSVQCYLKCCALNCLKSYLAWPFILSLTSRQNRLVPYLFRWPQNIMGVLIIYMTRQNPMLRDIRAQLCGPRFGAEIGQTVEMMLDWARDLKSTDSTALWCWQILQRVYHLK